MPADGPSAIGQQTSAATRLAREDGPTACGHLDRSTAPACRLDTGHAAAAAERGNIHCSKGSSSGIKAATLPDPLASRRPAHARVDRVATCVSMAVRTDPRRLPIPSVRTDYSSVLPGLGYRSTREPTAIERSRSAAATGSSAGDQSRADPTTETNETHAPGLPPRLWVRAVRGSGSWRSPASPRNWSQHS